MEFNQALDIALYGRPMTLALYIWIMDNIDGTYLVSKKEVCRRTGVSPGVFDHLIEDLIELKLVYRSRVMYDM